MNDRDHDDWRARARGSNGGGRGPARGRFAARVNSCIERPTLRLRGPTTEIWHFGDPEWLCSA